MPHTKISIALCTYNGEKYITEQLASYARQTQLPYELIVCDDGSTDATVDIVRQFAVSAPFPIKLYINEQNLGSTKNFEKTISLCNGDIIFLSDQDDVWREDKIASMSQIFKDHPGTGAIFSDAEVVDSKLESMGYRLWDSVGFNWIQQKRMFAGQPASVLLKKNVVTGATMAFRAKFIPDVFPIPKIWVHDGWIALFVAVFADLKFISEPLVLYRQHSDNQIGTARKTLLEQIKTSIKGSNKTKEKAYLDAAEQYIVIKERLDNYVKEAMQSDIEILLENKIKHLQSRAHIPTSFVRRFPLVVHELMTLRYHRYSSGFKSFLKDLVRLN
ncbi:MAG: glycosyltransferase family 2 protein [Thiobacillus sp.]